MNKKELSRFVCHTLILTAVAILMRSVSLSFNLYLRNALGEEGIGLFSLIMNLFSFAVTLASGGVTLVTTRLVAEALGRNRPSEAKSAFRKCLRYALFFGTLAFFLLFSLSELLGQRLLHDTRTIPSLKALAVSLPFLALSSSFSGYFTAVRRSVKSAAVQLGEQFCRIFLTVMAFTRLSPKDLGSMCLFVVLGSVVSDIVSCLGSALLFCLDEKKHNRATPSRLPKSFHKTLLAIALPVAFSSYFRSALVTVEHLLIPKGLVLFGLSEGEALAAFGVLEAMALPVVLFPYALLTPFCTLLVPEVARHLASGNRKGIETTAARAIDFTLLFGIGATTVLLTLSHSIGGILCQSDEAGLLIASLSPLLPIMYTDTAVDSLLKGTGEQLFTMRVNLFDSILGVLLALITVPRYGIFGYVFNIILCEIINFSCSITRLYQKAPPKLSLFRSLALPLSASLLSAFLLRRLLPCFSLHDKASLFGAIILSALLYLVILIPLRFFFQKKKANRHGHVDSPLRAIDSSFRFSQESASPQRPIGQGASLRETPRHAGSECPRG